MGVIINDFSLEGQFDGIDEFLDSLNNLTLPMLDILQDFRIKILSSYNSYDMLVTKDKNLYDMMAIRGSGEIRKLKIKLQELLFDDPFWEADIKSISDIYECDYTNKKSAYCLAEAVERNCPVISFEHSKFKESSIEIKKNNEIESVKNLFNQEIMLQILREESIITHLKYFVLKYSMDESFGLRYGKNYFNELVEVATLSIDDQSHIISDMEQLIIRHASGENTGRFSDTIDGKLKEFRTSLTNNRQIRFFYFEQGKKIIFMNGFLKKTQKTPPSEIDRAKRIMSEY